MQVEHGRGRHSKELHVNDYNKMLLVGASPENGYDMLIMKKYTWVNMLVYFVANW